MLIGCWIESAELKILGHDRTGVLWCVVMFDDVLFYHCSSRGRLCEEQRPRRNSMPWTVCPIVELNPRTETDSESKNYQQVVFFAYILYIYYIILYMYILQYSTCFLVRERLTMGGERFDFTRFCIIMHELVWLWDGHATFQTEYFKSQCI